jgi:tetratricopeptide (TPR) repeat protein
VAHGDQGRLEEAIREFQTALQLQPNYAEAHYNLGLVYRSKNMLQAARSEFEQALRIRPDFEQARKALEALPQ